MQIFSIIMHEFIIVNPYAEIKHKNIRVKMNTNRYREFLGQTSERFAQILGTEIMFSNSQYIFIILAAYCK